MAKSIHPLLAVLVITSGTIGASNAAPFTGGTGPGGFEANSGAGSLVLWFKADALSGGDGSAVTTWTNSAATTGMGSNANAGTAPTLQNDVGDLINGNPVVRFSGALSANSDSYLNGTVTTGTTKTFFSLARDTGTTGTCCAGGITTSGSGNFNGLGSYFDGGSSQVRFYADFPGVPLNGSGNILNSTTIGTAVYSSTATTIFRNGASDVTGSSRGQTGTNFEIGTRNNENSRFFKGDMAETGVFNRDLNTAERVVLENYLSSKWDVTMAANDLYVGDTAGNGHYDLDVFGIVNLSGQQVTNAGSAGFGIEATTGLDASDSLLAGHAAGNNSVLANRWSRAWYLDARNLDGNELLNLAFDWSHSGLGAPNATFTELFFSSTPGGPFNSIATGTLTGDTVNFTGLSGSLFSNGYYTLGAQQLAAVPEPGSLALWVVLGIGGLGLACRVRRS